jgi:hypothetical protein
LCFDIENAAFASNMDRDEMKDEEARDKIDGLSGIKNKIGLHFLMAVAHEFSAKIFPE